MYPAAKPMRADPRLNPVNMIVIISERRRCGAYSDKRVEAFGMAGAMPGPARKRRIAIWVGDDVHAVASVNRPMISTETIRTGLRPNRSEDGPATKAPTTRPNGAALITMPNAGREISHSCRM